MANDRLAADPERQQRVDFQCVDPPGVECLELFAHAHRHQLDRDMRVPCAKLTHRRRDDLGDAPDLDEGDAQSPHLAAARRLCGGDGAIDAGQRFARLSLEHLARFGELDAAPDPCEQLHADIFFELVNLPAERRRRDVQHARRPADVLVLRDGDEIAQVTQFHARQTTTWNPGRRPQSRTSSSDR